MLSQSFVEGMPRFECDPLSRGLERELPEARFAVLLTQLLDDALEALDSDREVTRASLRQASTLLGANQHPRSADRSSPARDALAPWQVRRILAYIDSRLGDAISLTELAAVTRLSVSHFSRAFRRCFGDSPHRYIVSQRVTRAHRDMLTTTD